MEGVLRRSLTSVTPTPRDTPTWMNKDESWQTIPACYARRLISNRMSTDISERPTHQPETRRRQPSFMVTLRYPGDPMSCRRP